jgi:hypothetical protein
MRDWRKPLYVIAAIAAWCLIFYILGASPSRGAGCLHPVHCTHDGNTSVCDCE